MTTTINDERSPVLLTEKVEYNTWVTGTREQAFGVMKVSDPSKMAIVQSGAENKDLLAAA